MRNGRKPRMTLQTLATIAMNLFTICCACYIMTIIWSRIDPQATFISRHTGVVCGIMAITLVPILLTTIYTTIIPMKGRGRHGSDNHATGGKIRGQTRQDDADGGHVRRRTARHDGRVRRAEKVMDEFGMPMQDDPDIEPIGHDEACDTAETLYHELLKHVSSGRMTLRFAQTMNRAWAELTVSDGLTEARR